MLKQEKTLSLFIELIKRWFAFLLRLIRFILKIHTQVGKKEPKNLVVLLITEFVLLIVLVAVVDIKVREYFKPTEYQLKFEIEERLKLLDDKEYKKEVSLKIGGMVYKEGEKAHRSDPTAFESINYAQVIDEYLKDTPMAGSGERAYKTAVKYNLPPYLTTAIARQESNLGRLGYARYTNNAWGWGIHYGIRFKSWQKGYEVVSKGLKKHYFDQGLTTPSEIEEKYAPCGVDGNSCGKEWSQGVNEAGQKMLNIQRKLYNQ